MCESSRDLRSNGGVCGSGPWSNPCSWRSVWMMVAIQAGDNRNLNDDGLLAAFCSSSTYILHDIKILFFTYPRLQVQPWTSAPEAEKLMGDLSLVALTFWSITQSLSHRATALADIPADRLKTSTNWVVQTQRTCPWNPSGPGTLCRFTSLKILPQTRIMRKPSGPQEVGSYYSPQSKHGMCWVMVSVPT